MSRCFKRWSPQVPQVIFPLWQDHYNFARRVEDVGVGLYGTRGTAPNWTRDGLLELVLRLRHESTKSEVKTRGEEG